MKLVLGNKNYSSWSLRAWLVMKQTGVPFEEIVIPLHEGDYKREIARYTSSGRVPALVAEERSIWDSLAIAEYLAERFPEKNLWPANAETRAVARSATAEMHSSFQNLRTKFPMNCRRSAPREIRDETLLSEIRRIEEIWTECLRDSGGDFLFGDFCIADAFYTPVASRFRTYGVRLSEAAERYQKNLLETNPMREWREAAENEPHTIRMFDDV